MVPPPESQRAHPAEVPTGAARGEGRAPRHALPRHRGCRTQSTLASAVRRVARRQLRSPIYVIPARVWCHAVRPYLDAGIAADEVTDSAADPGSFTDLMPDGHLEQFTTCPVYGEAAIKLALHERTSTPCRTAAAASQVLELWALGHRDPWTAADRPPLTFAVLQLVRWQRRITVVEYPKHYAAHIASGGAVADRVTCTVGTVASWPIAGPGGWSSRWWLESFACCPSPRIR